MPSCPNCGRTVGPGVYFCDGCGQVLFDESPTSQPGYPPPGYQGDHRRNLIDRFVNLDFKTITISIISLLVGVGVIIIVILVLLPDPSIKVTPPPGWYEASKDIVEDFSEGLEEEWPEEELDYISQ